MRTQDSAASDDSAWQRTVEEMGELAASLEANGWETHTVRAGDTAPKPPDAGESDRFGLVHTVSGADADAVRSALEDAEIEEYTVHRRSAGSTMFVVTELTAPAAARALFIAGAVDLDAAAELRSAARRRGEMYTHVQLLDWTHLGSVRHDDPAAFFPSLDRP